MNIITEGQRIIFLGWYVGPTISDFSLIKIIVNVLTVLLTPDSPAVIQKHLNHAYALRRIYRNNDILPERPVQKFPECVVLKTHFAKFSRFAGDLSLLAPPTVLFGTAFVDRDLFEPPHLGFFLFLRPTEAFMNKSNERTFILVAYQLICFFKISVGALTLSTDAAYKITSSARYNCHTAGLV